MNTNSIVRTHAEFFINKSFTKIPTVGTQHQFDKYRLQEKAVFDPIGIITVEDRNR